MIAASKTIWKMLSGYKPDPSRGTVRGGAGILFMMVQQASIVQHPTASRDLYMLMRALLQCPAAQLAKNISSEDICLVLDAASQCDTTTTACAASQVEKRSSTAFTCGITF